MMRCELSQHLLKQICELKRLGMQFTTTRNADALNRSLHCEASSDFCRSHIHRNNRPTTDLHPIKKASALNFADLFKARTPHSKPLSGGYMKHTLNAILHLPSAILADMKDRDEKRRRARIYRSMQQSPAPVRHTPVISAGIETYNIFGVDYEKR